MSSRPAEAGAPPAATRVWVAEPADAATVAELLIEFRDWLGRDWPGEDAFRDGVARLIDDPDAEYLLAAADGRREGEATGVCQLRYRHGLWFAADDCWLEDLYVRDATRGEGLGAALVEAALERARERGCRRIELDTTSDNAAALALYERFGFTARGRDGATSLLMRLRLPSA